jgi:hypothetical protein
MKIIKIAIPGAALTTSHMFFENGASAATIGQNIRAGRNVNFQLGKVASVIAQF